MKRPPCAICDRTNRTTRLCDRCRDDPANADWNEAGDDPADNIDTFPSTARHADLIESPARQWSVTAQRVTGLLCLYLIRDHARERRRVQGRRVWVAVLRPRPLHFREIAHLAGCSETYVKKVYRTVAE